MKTRTDSRSVYSRIFAVLFLVFLLIFTSSCGLPDTDPGENTGKESGASEVQTENENKETSGKEDVTEPESDTAAVPEDESETPSETESAPKDSGSETPEFFVSDVAGIEVPVPRAYDPSKCTIFMNDQYVDEMGIAAFSLDLYPESEYRIAMMDQEEIQELKTRGVNLLTVWGINDDRGEVELRAAGGITGNADVLFQLIGEVGGYRFFKLSPAGGQSVPSYEEKKELMDAILEEAKAWKDEIVLKVPQGYEPSEGKTLSFETLDLEGNAVSSEELFGENEITMINIWTSWCTYCVREFPELETMYAEFREKGCGIVGILYDPDTGLEDAKDIAADTGVTFPLIQVTDEIKNIFPVQAYPTTYFVDREGKVLNAEIVGAYTEQYRETMERLLLESGGKEE